MNQPQSPSSPARHPVQAQRTRFLSALAILHSETSLRESTKLEGGGTPGTKNKEKILRWDSQDR